jgi:predicted Zn-dependent protease
MRRVAPFATALSLALAAVVAAPPLAAGPGEKMLEEFEAKNRLYPDERWQRYVQEIGARILAQTPDAGKEYHFYVLDNDQVNAFATGDAYIFVSRGLLAFLQSEDQLAAVIGHEIGHVVARHMRKRKITDLTGKSLGFIGTLMTGRPELMYDVSNPLTKLLVSGYGRDMELEADRLGGEYMARAGYNPESVIDSVWVLKDQQLFAKKVDQKPVTYHGLHRTHPRNDKRLHDAIAYARGHAPDELAEPVGDFWALLDGLTFGDEAARGLVRDHSFYHGGLRLVLPFPEGWDVKGQQTQVTGTAPGGKAEASITFSLQEYVKRRSPAEYVTKVLRRDDVTGGEELEINDMQAYIGEIDTTDSNVQAQLIAVLYRGRDVFLFKGECGPKGDPTEFREQFRETLEAVRNMTAADTKHANARRIEIVVAEPDQTYEELAGLASVAQFPIETLRLLNADYPNGEPRAGDRIKIVR